MQNAAAKLVLGMKKHDSTSAALTTLHWLPIRARIDFKILTLVHKCLSANAPGYLTDLLVRLEANCEGFRSNNAVKCLLIPRTYCKTFADRAFSVYRPKKWNQLPHELRATENLDEFKTKVKTYLFKKYFY